MKFSYKFSNLLGTVYRQGDLLFSSDGNSVISPVGNRITIFDLKNNKSTTLPIESQYNYTTLDLSPNGCTLIAINEVGEAHMISLISHTIVHKFRYNRTINAIKFSPDGKYFAVCKDNVVVIYNSPGPFSGEYNAFVQKCAFKGAYDETTCLDWSTDSKVLAFGTKDSATNVVTIDRCSNFWKFTLTGHSHSILGCFFEENSLDVTTVSKDGRTTLWECCLKPDDLVFTDNIPMKKIKIEVEEDEVDLSKAIEKSENEMAEALTEINLDDNNTKVITKKQIPYKRLAVHYLADEVRKDKHDAELTAVAYHKKTKILVTGFSTGAFFIHEMPDVNLIHSLSISDQKISALTLNSTGDWIGIGCGGLGQLLVWEWQSETYVMKQQGHSSNMSCVSYSTEGQFIATGGEDGKVKLWNAYTSFCVVTFNEHTSPVTALQFCGNKKFLVSASLDGTVRAYDIIRYRNFRTFTSPRPVQLACVAVDSSGEFVTAGGQDVFEIFLWSVKMGRLLEILSGHEGPVTSLAFNPNPSSTTLASVSWDGSLRIWDALDKGSAHETIKLSSDGIYVSFKPNGLEVAVATLDGQITTFDVKSGSQCYNIDGRNDLGSGRLDTDLVTAKQSLKAKSLSCISYSADGECIIAGGQSKNVCIYNVKEGIILKKFVICKNLSFDGVADYVSLRKMTEFGNKNLIEEREEREGGNVALKLPGVRKGDMADRSFKPEVRVFSIQFSPTGQQWVAATTEGLLIYSLNQGLVFDPWDLQLGITPASVRSAIAKEEHTNALMMAMKLNEANLINEIMEKIPVKDVELTVSNLNEKYIERLLVIVATALESSTHLEFYLIWAQHILTIHGPKIKAQLNLPALISLQKSLSRKYEQLSKMCDFNKYTMQYVARLGEVEEKKLMKMEAIKDSDSDNEAEAMVYSEDDE